MGKRTFIFLTCFFLLNLLNGSPAISSQLHDAVNKGDMNEVVDLVNKGWDVNLKDPSNDTPLHWAAFRGYIEIVRLLLGKGADVNAKDSNNSTPLFLAATKGHIEIIKLLIDRGADVNTQGDNNWTPLHIAADKGNVEMARILIDKGVNVNAQGSNEWTPLHIASDKGNLDIVHILLDKGANVNAKNYENVTPLLNAIEKGHTDIVRLFLERGADVNVRIPAAYNWTPLHYASLRGYVDLVGILLKKGADVNARGTDNSTPLYNAAFSGYSNIVSILLQSGADPGMACTDGKTPLKIAEEKGHKLVVKLLKTAEDEMEEKLVQKDSLGKASARVSSLLKEARRHEEDEEFLEALRSYDKVIELQSGNEKAQEGKARAAERLEKAFNEAFSKGKEYADAGDLIKAAETLRRARDLKPINEKVTKELEAVSERLQKIITEKTSTASSAFKAGNYSDAVANYKAVLMIDRENREASAGLQSAIRQRDETAAKTHKEAKTSGETAPLLKAGTEAYKKGDEEAAVLAFKKALNIDPGNREAREYLAKIDNKKARASVEKEIEKHYLKGVELYTNGKFRDAIEAWNKVLELEPKHEKTLRNIERAKRKMDGLMDVK